MGYKGYNGLESDGVRDLDKAMRLSKMLGYTQRERRFNMASRYYWGKQYEHLYEWTVSDCPLREKQPSVQVGLTKKAVNRVNAHLFGEGHKPTWKAEQEALEEALQEMVEKSGLERRYLELGRLGTLHGTVAIGFHRFENGRYDTEVLSAGTSKPTFGRDDRVTAIDNDIDFDDLIRLEEYWRTYEEDQFGEVEEVWHRRDWELNETVEYEPIKGPIQDADQMTWTRDEELSVQHDLGFVPVEWITPIPVAHDIDGAPLVDEAEFKLEDEINYTLSQTGRGIRYNQEPTLVFTNVDANSSSAIKRGADNSLMVQSDPTRESSAGAAASLLEMNGNGAIVAMDYTRMIRNLFNEIVQVVDHDPEQFAGALSGVALERLLYPMVLLVENLRPEYEHKLGRLLQKMLVADGTNGAAEAVITAIWPPVVAPTAQDLQQYAVAVIQLFLEGIIDQRKAIEVLSPFLSIDDIDTFITEMQNNQAQQGTTQVEAAPPGTQVAATVPAVPGTEGA